MIDHSELLPEGREVGGFRIVKAIGHGNMGIIYRAVQINLNRPIALKVLFQAVAQDKDFVRSFFREAQAAAAFTHQNIVQAFDVGQTDDGIYYFAMELIEGGDISQQLKIRGTYTPVEALKYIVGIADGLDYGSTLRELTHGDIKPANIMITKSGKPKLADLGLARMGGEIQGESDGIMLTPLYAAPEMINGTWKVGDPRADMYSLGATIYHMIAGHPPFYDNDYQKVIQMQLTEKHEPLTNLEKPCPSNISKLVDTLLEKDQDKRFKDWQEAKAAIEHAIKEPYEPIAKKKIKVLHYNEDAPASYAPSRKKKKSNTPIIILFAAAGILGVAFYFMMSMKNNLVSDEYRVLQKELTAMNAEEAIRRIENFIKSKGETPKEAQADLIKYQQIIANRSIFDTRGISEAREKIIALEKAMKTKPEETAKYIRSKYKTIEKDLDKDLKTNALNLHFPLNRTFLNHAAFYNTNKVHAPDGVPAFTSSLLEKGANFTGQRINLGDLHKSRFTQKGTFSFTFWLKANSETFPIMGKFEAHTKQVAKGYLISLEEGKVKIEFANNPESNKLIATSKKPITLNSWEHITIIYDKGTASLYLNGKSMDINSTSNLTQNFASSAPLTIGFKSTDAILDNVMLWSKRLTKKEISEIYNLRKETPLENLTSRYQLLKYKAFRSSIKGGGNQWKRNYKKFKASINGFSGNFGDWERRSSDLKMSANILIAGAKEENFRQYLAVITELAPRCKAIFTSLLPTIDTSSLQKSPIPSGALREKYFISSSKSGAVFEHKSKIGTIQSIYYWDEDRSQDAVIAILDQAFRVGIFPESRASICILAALIMNKDQLRAHMKNMKSNEFQKIMEQILRDRE